MNVAEVVPDFADAFPFEEFNRMQREAAPAIVGSDENVVVSAPTASGKTALAELAICRTLDAGGTALFVAPLRALTNEKESEWDRFEKLGYSVYVVSGERDLNPRRARHADILVMTPEKVDSATRKHDSRRNAYITDVDLCIIDEVHLLDADRRGSVLEVTVSRLRRLCAPRIVALSATMRNVEEIAEWLDAPDETTFAFDDEYRPVELNAGVRTYTHGENAFADKYRRLFRALDLAEPHIRDDGQALVFVSSRQDTVRAAEKARDEIAERDIPMGARGDYDLHIEATDLDDDTLANSVVDGVAFHHAGLSKADKDRVEAWFRDGTVQLLFSTSTLAWGVNLPARCVVIRDTNLHDPLEGEVDMSPLDILQMLGRAGRPGYDDVGHAWIVCDGADAGKYRRLLKEGKEIESRLAEDLDAHLNAEIALGTITDLDDVMEWLETTFYYVRARNNPAAYEFEGLRDRIRSTLDRLVDDGFVETGDELDVRATPLGRLASKYYLRLSTAERFHRLATGTDDGPDDGAILRAVARAAEFDSVSSRSSEADAVRTVLSAVDTEGIDPGERKVLAILHGAMTGSTPGELQGDAWVIRQNAIRLLGAARAFLDRFAGPVAANRAERLAARIENGVTADAAGLTAIDGVGPGRASKLAAEGITTPDAVVDTGVEGIAAAGLSTGVAESVVENARGLPLIDIDWTDLPDAVRRGETEVREVVVRNDGGPARAHAALSVNGVEMSEKTGYLDDRTALTAAVHGADEDRLTYTVRIVFPELPVTPVEATHAVDIDR
ncbi:DEAD/DEAH box helicase [Halobacteriales archaeon SW_7_68_16]|nr:MAG: DEAD/DEAH box helicase [Halobacteriales archaeon SW_7_68_16]